MPALPGAANARFFLRKEIGEGWGVRAPESSRSGASFHGTLQGIPEVGALEVVFFFQECPRTKTGAPSFSPQPWALLPAKHLLAIVTNSLIELLGKLGKNFHFFFCFVSHELA